MTKLDIVLKICLLLEFVYIKDINTVYLQGNSQEYEAKEAISLNSESNEAYNNISIKENLVDSEDKSEMDNDTMVIRINKDTVKEVKIKVPVGVPILQPDLAEISKTIKIPKDGIRTSTVTKRPPVNYPFAVSIQRKGSHYTSGALVDKQWVLTSAREYYNVRESIKMYRARLGSVNCKRGGVLVPIKQVEVHPSYTLIKPAFDLALLKLGMPMGYNDSLAPIAISQTRGKVISAKFLSTYWARLIVKERVLPASAKERFKQNSMRVSTQKLIPWSACRKIMEYMNVTLDPPAHCLEPIISHHSPCMPDPGAPVLGKDGLWGITSGWTAKSCRSTGSPTVFTRLSSPRVQSWLQIILIDL